MKLRIYIFVTFLFSSLSFAEDYHAEIKAYAERISADYQSNYNYYQIQGSYYFSPVQTDNLPLAEAAFLGKNSVINFTSTLVPPQNYWGSTQSYTVQGVYYVPDSIFTVAGSITHSFRDSEEFKDGSVALGITPLKGLLISTTINDKGYYDSNLYLKYVTTISDHAVNLEAAFYDGKQSSVRQLAGDFYINNTFSLGGFYQHADYQNYYGLRAHKFFSSKFSSELNLGQAEHDRNIGVGVSLRF